MPEASTTSVSGFSGFGVSVGLALRRLEFHQETLNPKHSKPAEARGVADVEVLVAVEVDVTCPVVGSTLGAMGHIQGLDVRIGVSIEAPYSSCK